MQKIELEFNSTGYQKELNRLMELGKTMANVANYIKEITKNNVSEFDLESINEWIKNHYNFLNVQQVMLMQNQEAKYNFVKQFLLENDSNLLARFSLNNKGFHEPIKAVLSDLKKKYITYVNDELINDYKALFEAKELLEKCNKRLLKLTVKKTAEGVYIDLSNFSAIQNAYSQNLF